MTMNCILCLFTVLILGEFNTAAADWIKQPSPATSDLNNVTFVNPSTGWISGDSGKIYKTTNSGQSWNLQLTGVKTNIVDMFFLNERIGWALAWFFKWDSLFFPGTRILTTTNGGINWNGVMFPDTGAYKASVYLLDSMRVLLGGIPYFMHYSTNGGNTWMQSNSDSSVINNFPIFAIKFFNSTSGYACGGIRDLGGLIWTTTNSGVTWHPRFLGPDPINDVYLVSADSVIAICGDFKFGANIFTTSDFGMNWHETNLGYFGICQSIDFRTPSEGWITLGYGQRFFKSTDGGRRWGLLETPDSSALFDIHFVNDTLGWAVGANGTILKFDTTISSVVNYANQYETDAFQLYQNFPNPFNPSTVITYSIPYYLESGKVHVKLKIADITGRIISVPVDEFQNPGLHKVNYYASGLSSGIYFYTIEIAHQFSGTRLVKTGKMIYIQ